MFGSIGITELIMIAGIALVFLGPEKFPEFAKIVARTVRDVRGYMQEAQAEIAKELKPVQKELSKIKNEDAETYFEKLAGLAEADDDTEIAPEPDPVEWFDNNLDTELDAAADSPGPEGTIPFDAASGEAADEEEAPAEDAAERLDG